MTPEEIIEAYDVLAGDISQTGANEAAKIGNSQRSLGTLAERVASPSGQTSGLANYTYNRMLRPAVDTLTTSLVTTGKGQAMNKYLSDELMKAKNAYEDAKNQYTIAASSGGSGGSGGNGGNYTYLEKYGKNAQHTDTEVTYEGMKAGWDQASDLFTGMYNFTLDDGRQVELGGWDEELKKGSDGNYYIWNKKDDHYYKVEGPGGSTPGGGRWWTVE